MIYLFRRRGHLGAMACSGSAPVGHRRLHRPPQLSSVQIGSTAPSAYRIEILSTLALPVTSGHLHPIPHTSLNSPSRLPCSPHHILPGRSDVTVRIAVVAVVVVDDQGPQMACWILVDEAEMNAGLASSAVAASHTQVP